MAKIFNKVFNKEVKINSEILQQAKTELEGLYNQFKEKKDIDYIKVLKNKIAYFLDEKHKKIDDSTKDELKNLKKFLEEIEDYIKNFQKDEIILIDVVKQIEKKYKKQQKEPEENKNDYSIIYKKNSEIEYEKEMIKLQVELMKLQNHIKESSEKLLIIFEGRDAAGK
jgi:thiamine pyrophosphate-dependent acetolactate synthase large subunit-like protein